MWHLIHVVYRVEPFSLTRKTYDKGLLICFMQLFCGCPLLTRDRPDAAWFFSVFSQAEPENPDESWHLHLKFKTAPQPTSHDITKMQSGGRGIFWSHPESQGWTSTTCFPSHALLSNKIILYMCICVYVYIYPADTIKPFKASDW